MSRLSEARPRHAAKRPPQRFADAGTVQRNATIVCCCGCSRRRDTTALRTRTRRSLAGARLCAKRQPQQHANGPSRSNVPRQRAGRLPIILPTIILPLRGERSGLAGEWQNDYWAEYFPERGKRPCQATGVHYCGYAHTNSACVLVLVLCSSSARPRARPLSSSCSCSSSSSTRCDRRTLLRLVPLRGQSRAPSGATSLKNRQQSGWKTTVSDVREAIKRLKLSSGRGVYG